MSLNTVLRAALIDRSGFAQQSRPHARTYHHALALAALASTARPRQQLPLLLLAIPAHYLLLLLLWLVGVRGPQADARLPMPHHGCQHDEAEAQPSPPRGPATAVAALLPLLRFGSGCSSAAPFSSS